MAVAKGIQIVVCILVLFASLGYCRICYSCEGQACLRTTHVNTTKTCNGAAENCVAIFNGFIPIKKACYTDITAAEKLQCDATDDISCYACSTDRCNSMGRPDHKCKQCTGSTSESSCLNAPIIPTSDVRCAAPRTQDAYCAVYIMGNTTTRGCVMDNREILNCINNPTVCSICPVNALGACNGIEFPIGRRQCLACSGSGCQKADETGTTAKPQYCSNINDNCASMQYHGVFKRKCAQDLTVEEKSYCATYNESCAYCSTNNCNKAEPKNSGSILVSSIIVNIAMVFAVVIFN